MAYSVNTTPLLKEYDSGNEDEEQNESIIDNGPIFKTPEAKDKYYIVYLIFYFLGVVTLLPWYFFITADDYWIYKFRDVHNNSIANTKETKLQVEFTSYINVASAIPTLIFLVLNIYLMKKVALHLRIILPLAFMIVLFIVTLVLVNINTDNWQNEFFILTVGTVILLNASSSVLTGSLFGVVGKFSPIYMTALVSGQALGGIFAAVAQIVSLTLGASSSHSAFVYFTIGTITVFTSIVLYIILDRSVFYKYYVNDLDAVQSYGAYHNDASNLSQPVIYKVIFRKIWLNGLSLMLVFVLTLVVYPGVTVLIVSEGKGHGNRWNDVYFVPTVNYLMFNIGDYIGRIMAGRILKPKDGYLVLMLSISRFVFIPLLLLCNAQPRHHWSVVFDKDYEYIIILCCCAFSNGYLANLTSIKGPRIVEYHEREVASTIVSVFAGFGLTIGALLGFFTVKLL